MLQTPDEKRPNEADRKAAYRWCAAVLRANSGALRDFAVTAECDRIIATLEAAGAMSAPVEVSTDEVLARNGKLQPQLSIPAASKLATMKVNGSNGTGGH